MINYFFLIILFISLSLSAETHRFEFKGEVLNLNADKNEAKKQSLIDSDIFTISQNNIVTLKGISKSKKGLVVVFLSSVCPCSNSHVKELIQLQKEFKEFDFIGIHSNQDEKMDEAKKYFTSLDLDFLIIQDENASIADHFKAQKTPHAFIINPKNEIIYQGGVSSSNRFEKAEHFYLREALTNLKNNKEIQQAQTRALGCYINREKNNEK